MQFFVDSYSKLIFRPCIKAISKKVVAVSHLSKSVVDVYQREKSSKFSIDLNLGTILHLKVTTCGDVIGADDSTG